MLTVLAVVVLVEDVRDWLFALLLVGVAAFIAVRGVPAGIDLHVKPGDEIAAGQPLFTLLGQDDSRFERALDALDGAWEIGTDAPAATPLVLERITA